MNEVLMPMENFQVMGITAVLKALPKLISNFRRIKRTIVQNNPEAVILIDYAEFNMILARSLRKAGYRGQLIHYVCPSVWAWRKKRAKSLEKTLDRLLCILPFEPQLFDEKRLSTSYVGHPLVQQIKKHPLRPHVLDGQAHRCDLPRQPASLR